MTGAVVFEGSTKLAAIKRNGKVVQEAMTIPSISKAKAHSRSLQTKGLGLGQLQVVH